MAGARRGEAGASSTRQERSLLRIFFVVYLTAILLLLLDLSDGRLFFADVDDVLRGVQIRHLLSASGSFWDLTLPMIDSPGIYVSPWSRLVDLPYAGLSLLLTPLLGRDEAISASLLIWPPMLLSVYGLFVAMIWKRIAPITEGIHHLRLAAGTFAMLYAVFEFSPGRIDHHNFQIVALMAVAYGLVRFDRIGGIVVGVGTVMSVAIALEGLPFLVIMLGGLVVAFVSGATRAAETLSAASATICIATVPTALVLLGASGTMSTQCDAFSAPYIGLLVGLSGTSWIACRCFADASGWVKLAVLAAASIGVIVATGISFPECLAGPYVGMDPLAKQLWFDRVPQEQGLLHYAGGSPLPGIMLIGIFVTILVLAAPRVLNEVRAGNPGVAIVFVTAIVSVVLAICLLRYIRFPFVFAALFVPLALRHIDEESRQPGRAARTVLGVGGGVVMLILGLWMLSRPQAIHGDAVQAMTVGDCKTSDLSAISKVGGGHILAPPALAMSVLRNPMPSGLTVGPIPFHRASRGMANAYTAFITTDPETRREALAPFDYVAVCRFPAQAEPGSAPLYDALSASKDWPGLARLETGRANPFQLFRIDHANLR
ncbi:hypothetical protein [Neorhizobium sp. DAR64860/K0K1]|uniref:hypothetical protein n=1 Tax=Neorhizobium sp. DAR64860/K0K1 TaxID=3421955 RepID=UPI003D286B7D